MKKYEKPMIVKADDYAEGVYLASGVSEAGSTCFSTNVTVDQWDTDEKRFHVTISHHADDTHHSNGQTIVVSFPNTLNEVTFVEGGEVESYKKDGNTLVINATRHQNTYDNTSFNFGAKFSDVPWGVKPSEPTSVCYEMANHKADHSDF